MWLKTSDLKDLDIPHRTYHRKISSGEWESREVGKARNGKPVREVKLESLPHDLQVQFLQNQKAEIETPAEPENSSLKTEQKLIEALQRYEPDVRSAFQAEAQRLYKIVERYQVIEPKRRKNPIGNYEFVLAVHSLCDDAICTDALILRISLMVNAVFAGR